MEMTRAGMWLMQEGPWSLDLGVTTGGEADSAGNPQEDRGYFFL